MNFLKDHMKHCKRGSCTMISYSKMTEEEIAEYRRKSIEEQEKRVKEWKEQHKSVTTADRTPFDVAHTETPISRK